MTTKPWKRRGSVLLLVLVLIPVLAYGAYSFTYFMRAEAQAANVHLQQQQARWLAMSGIERFRALLATPRDASNPLDLTDNPVEFAAQVVTVDSRGTTGMFSLVAPMDDGLDANVRYGVVYEGAKIPLHNPQLSLSREGLMGLEGMTDSIADAILDWIDGDDETREFGAEVDYYLALTEPYQPRNGAPQTLGELLRVKGVTPYLLYGEDVNQDGILNPNENDGDQSWPPDNADGILQRGWAPYFTFTSAATNLTPEGEAKLNIKGELDEEAKTALTTLFGEEFVLFLDAYKKENENFQAISELIDADDIEVDAPRAEGEESEGPADGPSGPDAPMGNRQNNRSRSEQKIKLSTPWRSENVGEYLQDALEQLTVSDEPVQQGKIDINRASAAVLQVLPRMTEELANQIADEAAQRQTQDTTPAWLMTELGMDVEIFRAIEPHITATSAVYRVESVGFLGDTGPALRITAIIDASAEVPQIVHLQELRSQGSAYSRDVLLGQQNY